MKLERKSGKMISIGCCFPAKIANSGTLLRLLVYRLQLRSAPLYEWVEIWYRVGQINWDKIHFSITDLFMGGFGSNFVRISIK